jgi:hypothetical protein
MKPKQPQFNPVDHKKLVDALSRRTWKSDAILVHDLFRILAPSLGNPSLADFKVGLQRALADGLIKVGRIKARADAVNTDRYKLSRTPHTPQSNAWFDGVSTAPDVAMTARRHAMYY